MIGGLLVGYEWLISQKRNSNTKLKYRHAQEILEIYEDRYRRQVQLTLDEATRIESTDVQQNLMSLLERDVSDLRRAVQAGEDLEKYKQEVLVEGQLRNEQEEELEFHQLLEELKFHLK